MSNKKRKASGDNRPVTDGKQAALSVHGLIPPEFYSSKAWDTQAELLTPSQSRTNLLSSLFDTSQFRKILVSCEKQDLLEFGRDLNAVRFNDGVRETPNAQVADSKTVWGLYQQGCTLQVHQPQRFHQPLAALCSGLEQRLGCLVGINAYLTPPSTQGLAPHHDDVEIFVCQTEGSKRWRLYNFRKGFAKPSQPSGDLAEDSLGEPIMDVTLQVGDVLYMPRGTVHQAVAQDRASTHLTISTYQNWTYATLAQAVLHAAMQGQEEPICLPLALRHGLPPGFLFSHGFQADMVRQLKTGALPAAVGRPATDAIHDHSRQQRSKLAAGLRDLADRVEQQPELMSRAADLMSQDFMDNRAPPPEDSLLPAGPEPTMKDHVLCRGRNTLRIVPFEAPEAVLSGPLIKVVSCLSNSIKDHMMGDDIEHEQQQSGAGCQASCCDRAASGQLGADGQDEVPSQGSSSDEEEEDESEEEDGSDTEQADLVFPAMYSLAVAQLLDAHSHPVKVKDVKLDGDEVKLDLAVTMWKEGILSVQGDPSKRKSGKKLKH